MSQKIYTNLDIKGNATIGDIANATSDTDKFLVSDDGVVKYRTGSEMLSDLGVSPGVASNVQHQVKAGVAINKGQAVYVTSADGTNMIVGLASNTSEATSSKTMGLLNNTVAINGFANVVTEGLLAGINTIGAAAGDPVWLGTNGNLIYGLANKPSAPDHLVFIGIVTRVNANNGEIFVKVQNGFELNEIHDVDLKSSTPVGNQILAFEGAPVNLWRNKTIPSVLGYTPVPTTRTITINGNTQDLSANLSFSIASGVTSFNTRTGAITLTSGDVTGALGYTPYNSSNPAGYISSYTETDPTVPSHVKAITTTNISNWNTAFGWGNHASAGYVPGARTITINGTTQDLTANRSFTVTAVEVDTLATVTARGNSTSSPISVNSVTTTASTQANATLGTIASSWGGISYPTLYGSATDRWVMHINPHISYTQNGVNGFTGSMVGSTVRMASDTIATHYWDIGVGTNNVGIDRFSIGRNATNFLSINNSGNVISSIDMRSPIFYDSNDTSYYGDFASTSNFRNLLLNNQTTINTTTPGLTSYGLTFMGGNNDQANGMTWTWGNTNAQAGIYVQSSGAYGTKMYLATTDSFATGSKTAMTIDHLGNVSLNRGRFSNGSVWINNGTDFNAYNENIRLFNAPNGVSVIAFGASGTGGTPQSSILGFSDRYEVRVGSGDQWQQRSYNGYTEINGSSRAPIFYDSNNTGFYVDPNGTSNCNAFIANEFYANGWLRNYNINTGLYNQSTTQHLSSNTNGFWDMSSTTSVSSIRFYTGGHMSALRGYVYANSGNEIGFLNSGGNWSFRVDNSGNATATGDVTAFSDSRVKENVVTVENALEKVNALRGVYYNRIDFDDKSVKLGVIAQEVLEVVPEVVGQNAEGMYNVAYGNLAGLFIEAIKEQQTQIEELKELIKQLIKK